MIQATTLASSYLQSLNLSGNPLAAIISEPLPETPTSFLP